MRRCSVYCRALNNGNWQWLSCSRFFHQYFRCYSPVAFGKKTDPLGLYIKKWLPALQHMPAKYVFEPWLAPLSVQRESRCVLGADYPFPMVDHAEASKTNMSKMKAAYANNGDGASADDGYGTAATSDHVAAAAGEEVSTGHAAAGLCQKRKQPANKDKTDIRKFIKK